MLGHVIDWDEEATRATYDVIADVYADFFRSTEPEQPIELAMIEHFTSTLAPQPRVLDAGCGAGRMMSFLAELGCRVEGVDLSPEMVRRAQADHGEFRSEVASLTALPFAATTFDGLFMWYSTIHGSDDDLAKMLAEANRVLTPEGSLLVAFQTGDGVREVGQGIRERGYDVQMMRYHRGVSEMGRFLKHAGFRVIASFAREPVGSEADGQAVLIARRFLRFPPRVDPAQGVRHGAGCVGDDSRA